MNIIFRSKFPKSRRVSPCFTLKDTVLWRHFCQRDLHLSWPHSLQTPNKEILARTSLKHKTAAKRGARFVFKVSQIDSKGEIFGDFIHKIGQIVTKWEKSGTF